MYNSNPRIKCVIESKILIFLVCKNLNSSFFAWLTHLILEVSLHSWLLWPTVRHARPARRRRRKSPANERRYLGLRPARPLGLRLTTNLLRLTTNLHAIIHHARNFKKLYKNSDFFFILIKWNKNSCSNKKLVFR